MSSIADPLPAHPLADLSEPAGLADAGSPAVLDADPEGPGGDVGAGTAGDHRSGRRRIAAFLGVDRHNLWALLGSGLVVSLAILVPVVSYPSLVFSGPLEPYSGMGVGLGLLSAVVLTLALVIGGSLRGPVAVAQSEPAVVMGVVVVSIAGDLQTAGEMERILPTVMATIAMASLAVAASFLLLGTLKLANLIRFVPYPLIVGFIGGMGWLLIGGAVRVVTGLPLEPASLGHLAEPAVMLRWLPALAAGGALWLLQSRRRRALNVPLMAGVIVVTFWMVVLAAGVPVAGLAADGWMLAAIPSFASWMPTPPQALVEHVAWTVVLDHWPQILTLVMVSLMGVLMQASVIEIAARADVDLNQELRTLGIGNAICAMAGSLPGYHSLSTTLLAIRMNRPARLVSIVAAATTALLFFYGGGAIAYLPKLVIGALLFYVGLDVLMGALLNPHLRRARAEFAVAMLVCATVAFVGLLQGLAIGVAAGVVLFVIKYSQVEVVRRATTAVDHHSNVERSARARALLNAHGDRVLILELQGYIFFGTSNLLLSRIRSRLSDRQVPRPRLILLDFRRVTGADSSVTLSLEKLLQYGDLYDLELVVTGLSTTLRAAFERILAHGQRGRMRLFVDLDHGLEYCENQMLTAGGPAASEDSLERRLRCAGGSDHQIAVLLSYVDRCTYRSGEVLIRQGEASRDLFFVEHGSVTVQLVLADGRSVRLRTMGVGTVVGEVALYLKLPRSASVIAETESVAIRLSGASLFAMEEEEPRAAALLHAFMARELADKLMAATQQVAAGHA